MQTRARCRSGAAIALATGLVVALSAWACSEAAGTLDLVIRGGIVVDGSGAPGYRADVGIRGDRVVAIAPDGIDAPAREQIDASGLVVAPGFIDLHAHISNLHEHPDAENFLRQGVTTIANSLHSHDQPWPLDSYMAELEAAPNALFFAGHTWTRKQVLGLENRAADEAELEQMRRLVATSMRHGAFGLASGLEYVPATFAEPGELIELARVAAASGGIYFTHMRDEGPRLLRAVEETIDVARAAGIPAHINHHKVAGLAHFGQSRQTLALIDAARTEGLDVTHDLYPYTAFSTYSDILFPAWALADGNDEFARRVADPGTRARIEAEMLEIFPQQTGDGLASVQFRSLDAAPEYQGATLADLVADRGLPSTVEAALPLLIDLQLQGGFIGIFHSMDEEDLERILRHPQAMIESDGDLVEPGIGHPHPRSYGSFPRVLARYVRERATLSLETAIHKMTGLSAARLGLADRGQLRTGAFADVVVFDADRISDRSTYTDPHQYSVGVEHLLVNGVAVLRAGSRTGAMPGRALVHRER